MSTNPLDLSPRIRELFEASLNIQPTERAAWLDVHCTDAKDRLAVERLLTADNVQANPVVDHDFSDLLEHIGETDAATPSAGTYIGAFTLHEQLGEGGSSIVFRASREQDGVTQVVALKLLRRNLYTENERRRFRDERRALSQLQHPGIARLIEGGLTDTGTPYIALDLVEGKSIIDHSRSHTLDLSQRLRLFIDVCRAVEAAHRALIVHRDLKPSNVMVTKSGEVKLLDFGIAKLLDSASDSDHTQTQHAAMTPAYAAPEQFARGQITTATDVYSLGVLLGELITGHRHEPGDSRTPSAQVTDIAAAQAHLTSGRVMRKRLRGDLDNIVLKATADEPEQRYASAGAFADDIARHLLGEPVVAHPPSRLYRVSKFIGRHRGAVATTALFLVAIVAALGIAIWQADVARQQAQRAGREATRANATKDFLVRVFRASDPRIAQDKPRGQITAKELLDLNTPHIGEEFANDPDTRIELLGIAASIYRALDDEERFQSLHAQQIDLVRQHYGDAHPVIIDGLIDDAEHASNANDYSGARKALAQADPLILRAGLDQSVQRARWWLVESTLYPEKAKTREDSDLPLERAVNLFAQVAPNDPRYVRALGLLASHTVPSDPARAEQFYERAIAAAEGGSDRNDAELQQLTYPGLAQAREDQGNYAGAERAYEQGAALARRTVGEDHSMAWVPAAQHAWAVHRRGERVRAHALFDRLLALIPPDWSANSYDEYAREFYAACLAAEGRAHDSIPILEAAQRVYIERPSVAYELRRNRLVLGDAYDRVGRIDDARTMIKASLDERVAKEPADGRTLLDARERWGRFLMDRGDLVGAEEQFREVQAQIHGRRLVIVALVESDLARLALLQNDMPAALDTSAKAIQDFDNAVGRLDVRSGPTVWLVRSEVLRRSGDLSGARQWAQQALEASRKYDDPSAGSIRDASAAVQAATPPPERHP